MYLGTLMALMPIQWMAAVEHQIIVELVELSPLSNLFISNAFWQLNEL